MNEPLLTITDVAKVYGGRRGLWSAGGGVTALGGVSLAVHPGETLGLVGESGCGKSTLARLILALEKPTSGSIAYKGQDIFPKLPDGYRKQVQLVFQDPYASLNPRRSVGAAIAEPLVTFGLGNKAARKARVAELLAQVGLPAEAAARYPHEFSGGQRQRVAVARALAPSPNLLVLDEPVSALDVSIQAQILKLLATLKAELGLTYVFISHDLAVVHHVSDRVAVMYLGKLVELAPRGPLYENPRHPYTKRLLDAVPVPDPSKRGTWLDQDQGHGRGANTGCAYAPRCTRAKDDCTRTVPPLVELAPGHFAACYHPLG